MKDYYCLNIKFDEKIIENTWFHCHLFIKDKNIELKVYFLETTELSTKLFNWSTDNRNWDRLSLFTEIKVSDEENDLLEINTQNSKITGLKSGELDHYGNSYFSIILDSISISKAPISSLENNAKIYLNKQGFDLVKGFYSVFSQIENDKFDMQRMKGMDKFYELENSRFRPEFEFNTSDNTNNSKPFIEKIPIINFKLKNEVKESEVINYFLVACKVTSFYLGINIDFYQGEINLKDKRIIVFRTLKNQFIKEISSLNHFLDVRGTNGFLSLEWQPGFSENKDKIIKAIDNFVTARLLDENSKFLVLYNSIEVCMNGFKPKAKKFILNVSEKEKRKIYEEVFKLLKDTIRSADQLEFKNKWENAKKNLVYKPMDSPLQQFLIENNIPIGDLIISTSKMKKIRNNIIHGSLEKIDSNELETANFQLFKINTLLIFNLLGIKNWKSNI